ncbi:MAG TPA: nitroreductase [Tissierellia bacterium]|jgi:nitroreductase|nr:nitroreductase [Tissierellia bacterium]
MKYKEIISEIKSVRDYRDEEVSQELFDELKQYYNKAKRLVNDIEIEVLRKNSEVYEQLKDSAGYNNKMIKAPHYLIFLSEEKEHYIENVGYAAQDIMLKAWSLGIGSCWITFEDGEKIKEKLQIKSDKKLVALIAMGYEVEHKNKVLYENVSEYNPSKADVKVVEDNTSERLGIRDIVFMKKWGEKADPDELVNYGLLEGFTYGRLAPSTKNRQPWRFIVDYGRVVLTLKKDSYVSEYEEKIDTAVIMLYFNAVLESTLYGIEWKFGKPDKDYQVPDDYKIVGYCIV